MRFLMRNCQNIHSNAETEFSKNISGINGTLISYVDLHLLLCTHHSVENPLILTLIIRWINKLETCFY